MEKYPSLMSVINVGGVASSGDSNTSRRVVVGSMDDKFLVVRDRRTGRPVTIPTSAIPEEIRPDNWFENPDWRYRSDRNILEPLIVRYLEKKLLANYEVRFVAQYLVDYACHIAVAAYIFGGGAASIEFNVECIKRLRALAKTASTRDDIGVMIRVGMEYALDPL